MKNMKNQFSLLAYRNRLLLLLGVVALCGALVACQRMAPKPDPVEPTPVEPVTPTVPPEIAMDIEMSLRTMLLALSDPQILAVPQAEGADSAALVACSSSTTGDPTDSDGDNYPVSEIRDFDCTLPFLTGTAKLVLMDKDDADGASGVKATAESSYSFGGTEGPGLLITADVSLDASRSDGAADYDVVFRGSGGFVTPFTEATAVGSYDATLAGNYAAGSAGVAGGFTITTTTTDCATVDAAMQEACELAVQEAPAGSIELGVTTSGLVFDTATCPTTFTDGYFDVTDSSDNVLKATYDGCGPATVTYNGQPLPPPEMPS